MKLGTKALKFCFAFLLIATTMFSQTRVVTLPGTVQGALGGKDWDPAGKITTMVSKDDNLYTFTGIFPVGKYEYKVAINGAWAENYGADGGLDGGNIKLVIPKDKTKVTFTFNYTTKAITDTINGAQKIPAPKVEKKK